MGSGRGAGEFINLLGFVQCLQGKYLGSPPSSSLEAGVYGLIVPIEFPNGLYLEGLLNCGIVSPKGFEGSLGSFSPFFIRLTTLLLSRLPWRSSAARWLSKKGLHM